MDYLLFAKAFVAGFMLSLPTGPVNIFCIQQTLRNGRKAGFLSGLGAATADTLYAVIAAFSLSAITNILVHEQILLRVTGGLLLCYIGLRIYMGAGQKNKKRSLRTPRKNYMFSFFLTAGNPVSIFAFIVVFSAFNIAAANTAAALLIPAGVFCGAFVWWLLLVSVMNYSRRWINEQVFQHINKLSGLAIFIFGLAALASLV